MAKAKAATTTIEDRARARKTADGPFLVCFSEGEDGGPVLCRTRAALRMVDVIEQVFPEFGSWDEAYVRQGGRCFACGKPRAPEELLAVEVLWRRPTEASAA